MWVPKDLLLSQRNCFVIFVQNMHFWPFCGNYRPNQLNWCPVGWLGVGCGVRAALTIEHLPTLWLLGASFCSSGHHHRHGDHDDHVEYDVPLMIMIALLVKMIMMIMKEDDKSMIVMKIKSQLRGGFEQDSIRVRIDSVRWSKMC